MLPLDGVRILDLTRLLPGAYATLLLVDLGADVVKIEDPRGGDGMRNLPALGGRNVYFDRLNRGKRSVTLDLRSPAAQPVLDALISRSDVVVDSFRPATARRAGVDAATLHARYPRLICASITGFGHAGLHADIAAHDINYQALAGVLRPPALPGPLVGDIGASMQAALRILAALIERARTGTGSAIDVSIHEAAMAWSMFPETGDLVSACYNLYETADGEWLALGALEAKFWSGFCERIGRRDLIALQHVRGDQRQRVVEEVRSIMRSQTRDEWLARFAGADVCLTTIGKPEERAGDELRSAPALGADTDEILGAAGIDAEQRSRLRAARVV